MQLAVDGLRLNSDLRAVVCNIEMPASVLLDRQLARLSGIQRGDNSLSPPGRFARATDSTAA